MEVEAEGGHADPAKLDVNVRAFRQFADVLAPARQYLRPLSSIRSHAQHAADMVQDDGRVREGARQIDRVRQLRMVLPRLKAESQFAKLRKAFAEFGVAYLVRRHVAGGELADRVAAVPGNAVADATEPPAADGYLRLQHVAHARAQGQVRVTDDPLGNTARAVIAGSAHRRDAVDELHLTHRRHLGWPALRYIA